MQLRLRRYMQFLTCILNLHIFVIQCMPISHPPSQVSIVVWLQKFIISITFFVRNLIWTMPACTESRRKLPFRFFGCTFIFRRFQFIVLQDVHEFEVSLTLDLVRHKSSSMRSRVVRRRLSLRLVLAADIDQKQNGSLTRASLYTR